MDLDQLEATPSWEWPEDARDVIRTVLTDPAADVENRMLAAYLGGDIEAIDDQMADALMEIVGDGAAAEPLRAQAAIALGPALEHADMMGFDDEEDILISEACFEQIKSRFEALYREQSVPKEVRRRILEALVRAPAGWHADAVRQAYVSGDHEWRLTAVFGMQYIEGFTDEILASLGNPDPEIHFEAVIAAGNWQLEGAWDHVAALVRDDGTEKELRLAAIEAAAGIGPDQVDRVFSGLLDHKDPDIVDAVQEALAMAEAILSESDEDEDALDDD